METSWGFESLLLHHLFLIKTIICFTLLILSLSKKLINYFHSPPSTCLTSTKCLEYTFEPRKYIGLTIGTPLLSKKTFSPAFSARSFRYVAVQKSSHLWYLSVHTPVALVAHIQNHITQIYRNYTLMPGVSCTRLPVAYTQKYFASEIERDTKQFLLDHFVNEGVQHYLSDKHLGHY